MLYLAFILPTGPAEIFSNSFILMECHLKLSPDIAEGIHLQSLQTWFICILIILITTGSKEADYQPIIASQERWPVDGTEFQIS